MKFCPVCKRTYADPTVNFCRIDGASLKLSSSALQDQKGFTNPATRQDLTQTRILPTDPFTGSAPSGRVVQTPKRALRKAIDSLAVLPLVNESKDPAMEYLSDGITESIINNLSQLPQLRVMARSTVFRYKAREVDPQEVRNEL